MNQKDFISQFLNVRIWRSGEERAPHKPLTLLYALGQLYNGIESNPYKSLQLDIEQLFKDFGPSRKAKVYYPFIKLANDGIWKFNKPELIDSKKEYSDSFLMKNEISGGFSEEILQVFSQDVQLVLDTAQAILNDHFPNSLHEDILKSCGLPTTILPVKYVMSKRRVRDPKFRNNVLNAYNHRCAICGYQVKMNNRYIGVEAAHIKWHQTGGADSEDNGLALCSIHHKLFDAGAFNIKNMKVETSKLVGGLTADKHLHSFDGHDILAPKSSKFYPETKNIIWHVNEVFKVAY